MVVMLLPLKHNIAKNLATLDLSTECCEFAVTVQVYPTRFTTWPHRSCEASPIVELWQAYWEWLLTEECE